MWKEKVKDDWGKGKWKELVKRTLKEDSEGDSEGESGIGATLLLSIYYMDRGSEISHPHQCNQLIICCLTYHHQIKRGKVR